VVVGFVPSTLDVGVSRAGQNQAEDTVSAATLGARLDYHEATEDRKSVEAEVIGVGHAIERKARNGTVSWIDERRISGVSAVHVAWLRGLVAPARLDAGRLDSLTKYTAAQRLALVRSWNAGARFVFGTSSPQTLALPRGPAARREPFGAFAHSAWTADARTSEGSGFLGGMAVPALGFSCIRCPPTQATAFPISVRAATEIPDGVTDPGLGVRDEHAYMPPTSSSKPGHLEHHSGFAALSDFPWDPYEPYATLVEQTSTSGFKRTKLMNTAFVRVHVPPLFAVYLTPHYHGYHASTQSCHRGFALFRSSAGAPCFESARGGVVYGTCPDVPYPRCAKEVARGATSAKNSAPCTTTQWMPGFGKDGVYVPGVLLLNDDAGSEWVVRPGDVVQPLPATACDDRTIMLVTTAPAVVNCCAAWNYAVFPHYGVVRASAEPWSGDMPPTRDAVGDVACASRAAFVKYHRSLGIVVAFRSGTVAVGI
jgi:hypothetical protein